tara:strand:- start:191 stop:475 length:285 start_codon:yes stop_codon:yes gene_type:complete
MINYITPIEKELNEKLHEVCNMFMLMGGPSDTPRYYNYKSLENGILKIGSTQKDDLFFQIKTDFEFINAKEFWPQFREYRTNFLLNNYKTINAY